VDHDDTSYLGNDGGYLGFSGGFDGTSWAVELDTYENAAWDESENHVALLQDDYANALASSSTVPEMEDAGELLVEVWFDAGAIEVYVDGTLTIEYALESYPESFLLGFTGATGGSTNAHDVDDLYVSCF